MYTSAFCSDSNSLVQKPRQNSKLLKNPASLISQYADVLKNHHKDSLLFFQSKGRTLYKKENEIFLIFKEIQLGSVVKSYMRKGCLIYEAMRKYLTMYMRRSLARYDFATVPS